MQCHMSPRAVAACPRPAAPHASFAAGLALGGSKRQTCGVMDPLRRHRNMVPVLPHAFAEGTQQAQRTFPFSSVQDSASSPPIFLVLEIGTAAISSGPTGLYRSAVYHDAIYPACIVQIHPSSYQG